jgi:hypothetical protein
VPDWLVKSIKSIASRFIMMFCRLVASNDRGFQENRSANEKFLSAIVTEKNV